MFWIDNWLRAVLILPAVDNLENAFSGFGFGAIDRIGYTPDQFHPAVFNLIQNISANVVEPIAMMILAFLLGYDLVTTILERTNSNGTFEMFLLFKWFVKAFIAIWIVSSTFDIIMVIFGIQSWVVTGTQSIFVNDMPNIVFDDFKTYLETLEIGMLFNIYMLSFLINLGVNVMNIAVMLIIYGRMITIFLKISLSPIPMVTFINKDWQSIGQNHIKSLFALAFQAFLIILCIGIYAIIAGQYITDVMNTGFSWTNGWSLLGYMILLCFMLFKTGSISNSVFGAS